MNTELFREEMRYEYDLTPDSVVVDCGGYEGRFAEGISQRYNCHVIVLEPIIERWGQIKERFAGNPKIKVEPWGIGGEADRPFFHIKGDMTGKWADGQTERVVVLPASTILATANIATCDLIKLNIEGMEFEVLENILDDGLATRFKNIQVQWHDVAPKAEERRNAIIARLSEAHELTFDHGWIWQNWKLKA